MTGPSSPGESSEQEPRSVRREVKTCCASTHVETYKGEYEISAFIPRPRVARAGTNKLKCQKNIPTGSHLTQMSAGVPNLNATLNLNNFGQNGQN